MREILFRGKNHENNQWVYGQYCTFLSGARIVRCIVNIDEPDEICYNGTCYHMADFETVCQYIGFNDKNAKNIFEGDIVKIKRDHYYENKETINQVYFYRGAFFLKSIDKKRVCNSPLYEYESNNIEIIGNIHDNHEMLEGK